MRIPFEVGGTPVEFRRNWFTGGARLWVAGADIPLQSAFDPATHYSMSLTRVWRQQVEGQEVVIEKVRPLFLAGFRRHCYRVLVDGQVVAERRGY
jgi:hypothetical protein